MNVTDSGPGATTITSALAGDQQVTLSWSGPTVDNYTVYYTTNGSTPTTSSPSITIPSGATSPYVINGLTNGTDYNFSMVAHLGSESSSLSPAVSATLVPDDPTGLAATDPMTGTSLDLSWTASTGADNYTVYWIDNSTATGLIVPDNASTYDGFVTVNAPTTTVSASPLTNGTNYNLTVIATNTGGNSSSAAEVNATPVYVAPGITVTHNAGPTPQNTHDNQTMVNEAGYATGFVEWEVTDSTQKFALARDSVGNIYHAHEGNCSYPAAYKYNSVGDLQCGTTTVPGTGYPAPAGVPSTSRSYVQDMVIDSESNIYVIGNSDQPVNWETPLGAQDIFVIKYASDCSSGSMPIIWAKLIGTTLQDDVENAEICNDIIYINGTTSGDWGATHHTGGGYDSVVVKMDTDGNVLSVVQTHGQTSYGASASRTHYIVSQSLAVASNGDYYQSGRAFWDGGNNDAVVETLDGESCTTTGWSSCVTCYFVRKFDSNHNHRWTKVVQAKDSVFSTIRLNSDETQLITAGVTGSDFNSQTKPAGMPSSNPNYVIVNSISTTNGSINWTKFTGYQTNYPNIAGFRNANYTSSMEGDDGMMLDGSDNIFIAHGRYSSTTGSWLTNNGGNYSRQYSQVTKLNSSGTEVWSRVFGGTAAVVGSSTISE